MSVWLRLGRDQIRLELLTRWKSPPVVAPHRAALHRLVNQAAGIEDPALVVSPAAVNDRVRKIGEALHGSSCATEFRSRGENAKHLRLVIPDATRRGPWVEWAYAAARWLETLTPRAISRVVLVATGVHRPALAEGVRFPAGWSLVANGEGGFAGHREVGETPAGTRVRLHPAWVDGDLRVALGDVTFHYFAGFGGGRKLVFPGLGDPEGILSNHRLCLDWQGRLHPCCAPGTLLGNPVHDDLLEAVRFCPPNLLIQVQEAEPGGATELLSGDWISAHEEGCRRYLDGHRIEHSRRPDVLVCDAGGHPRDATFLQAHKSLQHAARFLPDRGRLLLLASLEDGSGSLTLEKLWGLSSDELRRRARDSYELHTHTALAVRSVVERVEVGILSRMSPDQLRIPGLRALTDIDEAIRWAEGGRSPRHWGWLHRAEEVLPSLVGASRGRARVEKADGLGSEEAQA